MEQYSTSMVGTATRYGVHGLLTIHELRSFCSIRVLLMSRGMTQLFGVAWDFGSMVVVNLFAYRATDYRELFKVRDPIGEENNRFLMQAVERCSTIVLGWGTKGPLLGRDRQIMSLLAGRNDVYCLGITKDGQQRHPLYVK